MRRTTATGPSSDLLHPTQLRSITCHCGQEVRFYESTIRMMETGRRVETIRLTGTSSDGHVALLRDGELIGVECPINAVTELSLNWLSVSVDPS